MRYWIHKRKRKLKSGECKTLADVCNKISRLSEMLIKSKRG